MEHALPPASSPVGPAKLPPEILLHIIEAVVPANPRALVAPSHSATRTLLSLTRVSRATYELASRLLRQRCAYVDSARRLADLLLCMPRLVPTLPPALPLRHLTSLYLAPFGKSLDDQPVAMWVRELFCEVCETLRRLVVQMPFSTLDWVDDHLNVKKTLREGFEQLHRLEEFVCVGEYPMLSGPYGGTDVWRLWPDLKRVALFGCPMTSHWLWWDIATLPKLEHVVLANSLHLDSVNIKDEYFHKLPRDDPRLTRKVKVVLMEAAWEAEPVTTVRWEEIDPEQRMTVELYEVPRPFYADDTPRELVTDWVRRGALEGSLWEWEGQKIG